MNADTAKITDGQGISVDTLKIYPKRKLTSSFGEVESVEIRTYGYRKREMVGLIRFLKVR